MQLVFLSALISTLTMSSSLQGCGGGSHGPTGSPTSAALLAPHKPVLGPPTPATPLSTISPTPAIAPKLKVRMVFSSPTDSKIPDPDRDLDFESDFDAATNDGNSIVFHQRFFLPDPSSPFPERRKELFLVWSDQLDGAAIQSATYSHHMLDAQGQWLSGAAPTPVWHDADHSRWFIPISDLFNPSRTSYPMMNINLSDTQVITLELVGENKQKKILQLKFQIYAPLPILHWGNSLPNNPKLNASEFVKTVSTSGWVLRKNTLTNPTTRTFHLWIRSEHSDEYKFKLTSHIDPLSHLTAEVRASYPFPNMAKISTGELEISEVEATHQDRSVEREPLQDGLWHKVTLLPSETLTLGWRIKRTPHAKDCALPEDLPFSLTPSDSSFPGSILAPIPNLVSSPTHLVSGTRIPILLKWAILAAEMKGMWHQEVRLAHSFTPKNIAVGEPTPGDSTSGTPDSLLLSETPVSALISVGTTRFTTERFNCQGFFP